MDHGSPSSARPEAPTPADRLHRTLAEVRHHLDHVPGLADELEEALGCLDERGLDELDRRTAHLEYVLGQLVRALHVTATGYATGVALTFDAFYDRPRAS